jgi:hypothetical protein
MVESNWLLSYGADPEARETRIKNLRREGLFGILLCLVGFAELVFVTLMSGEPKNLAEAMGISVAVLVMIIGIALRARTSIEVKLFTLLTNVKNE